MKLLFLRIVGLFLLLIAPLTCLRSQPADTLYYRFPNTTENKALFDQNNPFGLAFACSELLQHKHKLSNAFSRITGISASDQIVLLSKNPGKSMEDLGFQSYLGPQGTTPLSNIYGEDSVIRLSDGTTEYLYPERKIHWINNRSFDELVIQVIKAKQSDNSIRLIPQRAYFQKTFTDMPQPITVLSFEWSLLYEHRLDWWEELKDSAANNLLVELQHYQDQQFEAYTSTPDFLFNKDVSFKCIESSLEISDLDRIAYWDYIVSEWFKEPYRKSETVFRSKIKETRTNLVNIYGEDSISYDFNGKATIAYESSYDTLVACEGPFHKIYKNYHLEYEPGSGWKMHIVDLCATVQTEKGFQFVYFTASEARGQSPEERKLNPLSVWLENHQEFEVKQLNWESLLENLKLKKEITHKP